MVTTTLTSSPFLATLTCLALVFFFYALKLKSGRVRKHLPPGPKPVPVLGNVRDLRAKELWIPASSWAKQYGDVVYLHVFGQGLIFINSPEAASDLLDKRGAIYADKPQFTMACELCGCKNMVAFTPYGDQSKRQRKLMHKAFAPTVIPTYQPLFTHATRTFLHNLLSSTSPSVGITTESTSSQDIATSQNSNTILDKSHSSARSSSPYLAHLRHYAGSLTLSVVYGYTPTGPSDPFLLQAEECVAALSNDIASAGGVWPVDLLPFLAKIPKWAESLEQVPGMGWLGFKRKARVWKKMMEDFVDQPFEWMRNSMKSGHHNQSFCSTLLEDEKKGQNDSNFEFDLKWTANSMYSASIDTTITTVSHFLLAVMEHPEVLRKAQAEIDAVVGEDRLPTFGDRPRLRYVEAVLEEVWRWGVPVPLNLPHKLMEDDVYRGMHLPKGSLVFGNIWAMTRDERLYPDPEKFNPERFMDKDSPDVDPEARKRRDPRNYVFGFGRRQCPGSHLVDASLWLLIASMIATLDISKPVDDNGNVIEPVVDFENPIFRTPNPFKCDFRPRSEKALGLIRQMEGF